MLRKNACSATDTMYVATDMTHGVTDTRPGLHGMACVKTDLKCLNLTKGAVSK